MTATTSPAKTRLPAELRRARRGDGQLRGAGAVGGQPRRRRGRWPRDRAVDARRRCDARHAGLRAPRAPLRPALADPGADPAVVRRPAAAGPADLAGAAV